MPEFPSKVSTVSAHGGLTVGLLTQAVTSAEVNVGRETVMTIREYAALTGGGGGGGGDGDGDEGGGGAGGGGG